MAIGDCVAEDIGSMMLGRQRAKVEGPKKSTNCGMYLYLAWTTTFL